MIELADLDKDGKSEFLVSVEANTPSAERTALLLCVSASGKELWRFSSGRHVSSPIDDFPLPFRIPAFAVLLPTPSSPSKVVVSGHQLVLYANQVALLDARTGLMEREYWHSGALQRILIHDANGDSRPEIYLGGIHNSSKRATLVVLDPATMAGASVEENPNYQLAGLTPGVELGRVFFPASCYTRKLGECNTVGSIKTDPGGIEVDVLDPYPGQTYAAFHYFLRPDLSFRSLVEGDNQLGIHNALHLSGFLDHDFSEAERAAKRAIEIRRPSGVSAPN